MISQAHDLLSLALVADFGAAENDGQPRPEPFQEGDQVGGQGGVPDVDAQAEDARLQREQRPGDLERPLADCEFRQRAALAQPAQVRAEAAQPERGVQIAGIQRGEDDVRHGASSD